MTYEVLCRLATFTGSLPDERVRPAPPHPTHPPRLLPRHLPGLPCSAHIVACAPVVVGWLDDRDFGNSYPWVLSHDSPEGEEATRGYDDVKYFLWDTPPYENIGTLAIARINKFVVNGRDETAGDSADDDEGGGQGQGDDDAKPASVEENEEMVKEAEKQGRNVLIKLNVKIRTKSQFFGAPTEATADRQQEQQQAGEEKEEGEAAAEARRSCVPRQLLLQKRYTDPFTYTRVQELLYDLNDSVKRAKSSD
ncbi:uncharacterized protein ACA1_041640, partial [Acanthamoeba castellanii str. Neff]